MTATLDPGATLAPADSGLAPGHVAAPAWGIALLGAAVVSSGIAYFIWRAARARPSARRSIPPRKSR